MVRVSGTLQIFQQQEEYHTRKYETEPILLDFRAPPPSPTGSSRRGSFVDHEEDVLSELLETCSLRVSDLNLPDKIFPREKSLGEIPTINFQELMNSYGDDQLVSKVKESIAEVGCFQLIDHGVSGELIETVARRAARIFRLSPEEKRLAASLMEFPYGFEDVGVDHEEGVGEMGEEFVWGRSCCLESKMEGILPTKYSKFSKKMEKLTSSIEKVSKEIMLILVKDRSYDDVPNDLEDNLDVEKQQSKGSICHIYKHPQNVLIDQCISSVRYDVIRMMVRGSDYSHSLSLHICDGCTEFHVYSKKGWASFTPLRNALVVTLGDQLQGRIGGRYKEVIGKPIYATKNKDCISMAFLYAHNTSNSSIECAQVSENGRIISLQHQALFAIFFTIACKTLLLIWS